MDLKPFGKEILSSAQKTLSLELSDSKSEVKKATSLLLDALMLRLVNLSVALFGVLFVLLALLFAFWQWFDIPLWAGSAGIAVLAWSRYFFIKYKKDKI